MTGNNGGPQVTVKSTILSMFAIFAFISCVYALPDLKGGSSLTESFKGVWSSRQFWVGMMIPLEVFIICFPLVFTGLWKRFIKGKGAMAKVRFLTLGAALIYLVSLVVQIFRLYNRLESLSAVLDKMGLSLVYGVFVLFIAALAFFFPSEEKAKAMETGDYTRVYDERHLQVTRASAHTSLIIVIVLLFGAGSLVDILIYHTYPIRAWIEGFGSLAIWQVVYMVWNRRI